MTPDPHDLARRFAAAVAADSAVPVVFRTASGCWVEDISGKRYLDFISGYGVVTTGWQRPEVLAAIQAQLKTATFAPPWLPTREAVLLAEALLAVAPPGVVACGRAAGGADAVEVAVRAAHAARGGRALVVGRAYHGGTSRTLALSDGPAFRLPPTAESESPRVPPAYCYRCPWGKTFPGCSLECAEAVEKAAAADPTITAVLLEPIIGSGGVIVPPAGYFSALQDMCKRRGLLLIADEVMTGCGRTGTFLAGDGFGLRPDAVALAKGLGGGYVPIGAALLSRELADGLAKFEDVSATFAWTPLACAAAFANLRLIQDEKLPERSASAGAWLLAAVREACERTLPGRIGEVRGRGLMIGIEVVKDRGTKQPDPRLAKKLALRCLRNGLMVGTSWDWFTIILMPPLTATDAELADGVGRLEAALRKEAGGDR